MMPSLCSTESKEAGQIDDPTTEKRFHHQKATAPLCDICIADAVGLLNRGLHAVQTTGALGTTSDFTRENGVCSICKRARMVIHANQSERCGG